MKGAYYIPNGIKNLKLLFPTINYDDVQEYFIEVLNRNGNVVATTPLNKVCNCAADEKIRVHFLNYAGTYDALNFQKPKIVHEDTAGEYENGLSYPLEKTDTGIERFNVKSNDIYEVKLKCREQDMPWLQECADSPKMFIEWVGTEGQPDDYLPIVKSSGKFEKLKNVEEYNYEFVIQFKLSNEFQTIRN